MRGLSTLGCCALALISTYAIASRNARASTYTVNSTNDTHDANPGDNVCRDSNRRCSLRAAVEESEAHAGYDIINLPNNHYVLSNGPLTFNVGNVDVYGAGRTSTIIDANHLSRVISEFAPAANGVGFADLTIENGKGGNLEPGGGVYVYSGKFYGNDILVTGNQTTSVQGGGIAVGGYLWCADCTISGNSTNTKLTGGAQYSGGGVFVYDGAEAYIIRTTISGNTAIRGGGVAGGGTLTLSDVTVSGNTAIAGGGGLRAMTAAAQWSIAFSTITANTANSPGSSNEPNLGGGIFVSDGTVRIGKSLLSGNSDGRTSTDSKFSPDCATTSTAGATGPYTMDRQLTSYWDNIYGNIGNVCTAADVYGGDLGWYDWWGSGTNPLDPGLGPLQDNGGYVKTHALPSTSFAVDFVISGNPTGGSEWIWDCVSPDATAYPRPQGYACDSGSYESR